MNKRDFHPQSVILHADCDFHSHECNFDTFACEYDTHECNLYMSIIYDASKYDTYECDTDTHECDLYTHKSDFYTHKSDVYKQNVIVTLTRQTKLWYPWSNTKNYIENNNSKNNNL
jgi:hypothetical protein